MRPDELEHELRQRLDALGPAPRALHVLMLPDLEWTERIGEFWSYPQSRTFAELLIDCEEDRRKETLGSCALVGSENDNGDLYWIPLGAANTWLSPSRPG